MKIWIKTQYWVKGTFILFLFSSSSFKDPDTLRGLPRSHFSLLAQGVVQLNGLPWARRGVGCLPQHCSAGPHCGSFGTKLQLTILRLYNTQSSISIILCVRVCAKQLAYARHHYCSFPILLSSLIIRLCHSQWGVLVTCIWECLASTINFGGN